MPRRVEDYRGLAQKSRVLLLRAVQLQPGQRLQALAETAGVHINTARDHLRVLEEEGLITCAPATTGARGRPPTVYAPVTDTRTNPVAAQRAESAKSQGDLLRKLMPETDHTAEIGTEAAHQIDTLYVHLEDVGLEPEFDDDDSLMIDVHPCPFMGLIDDDRRSICGVHATLVQHQLAQVPGPLKLGTLTPFVTPDRCQISLRHKHQPEKPK